MIQAIRHITQDILDQMEVDQSDLNQVRGSIKHVQDRVVFSTDVVRDSIDYGCNCRLLYAKERESTHSEFVLTHYGKIKSVMVRNSVLLDLLRDSTWDDLVPSGILETDTLMFYDHLVKLMDK